MHCGKDYQPCQRDQSERDAKDMHNAIRDQLRAIVVPADHTAADTAGMRTGLFQAEDRHASIRLAGLSYIAANDSLVTVNEF